MNIDEFGRIELFRALVGSNNYNLHTPESDMDWKIFVIPTFDDLYNKEEFSKSISKLNNNDYDIYDIRNVSNLWWKANVNFLEVLYSDKLIINKDLDIETNILLRKMISMRKDIVTMNLPYLYNACVGMSINKVKLLDKGTKNTMDLKDKYGYDTKQGLHAYRILDFLERFYKNDFKNFGGAIKYTNNREVDALLEIRFGGVDRERLDKIISMKMKKLESEIKQDYLKCETNEEIRHNLNEITKQIVRLNI